MEVDLSVPNLLLLIAAGGIAGFINVLAGAGSLLTIPVLLIIGLPGGAANATNRVGVITQSVAGAASYRKAGKLDVAAIVPITVPALLGAVAGAWLVTLVPDSVLTPILLASMVAVGVLYAAKPGLVAPPPHSEPRSLRGAPSSSVWLFAAGLYGGFLQTGVGIALLAILGGVLRYDLIRGNALKVTVIALYNILALAIFAAAGLVRWLPGLILAGAMALGALLGVRFAVTRGQVVLRWIVLAMVIAVVVQQSVVMVRS